MNKNSKKNKSALVIQGGALRGVHTSGVLEVLSEAGLTFDTVTGISAGALNGLCYIAGQEELYRASLINTKHVREQNYIGRDAIKQGHSVVNFNFLFDGNGRDLPPFNYASYLKSHTHFECGAVNCDTGQLEVFERGTGVDMRLAVTASASLPLLGPTIEINGQEYLDGGICEAILYRKALADGYGKIVLVLTREKGYRDKESSPRIDRLMRLRYFKHPKLVEALLNKSIRFNALFEQIEQDEEQQKEGLFVIRPSRPVTIDLMNLNQEEMESYHRLGRADAKEALPLLLEFLRK